MQMDINSNSVKTDNPIRMLILQWTRTVLGAGDFIVSTAVSGIFCKLPSKLHCWLFAMPAKHLHIFLHGLAHTKTSLHKVHFIIITAITGNWPHYCYIVFRFLLILINSISPHGTYIILAAVILFSACWMQADILCTSTNNKLMSYVNS